ncbi:MAG: RNA-binding S4 domain-containing protein [Rhodospirillaceae bacterium]|nr:RNA-binding S4 domain-containing protein [Rhodospirillaceae bacterium]
MTEPSLRHDKCASLRLDKWLWFARFCKTRALAQKLIERGQVTLNGARIRKPSASVRPNDKLILTLGAWRRQVTVVAMGAHRGPPSEAQALYVQPTPPERLDRDDAAMPLRKPLLIRPKGAGRPTKRDRRAIDQLLDGE